LLFVFLSGRPCSLLRPILQASFFISPPVFCFSLFRTPLQPSVGFFMVPFNFGVLLFHPFLLHWIPPLFFIPCALFFSPFFSNPHFNMFAPDHSPYFSFRPSFPPGLGRLWPVLFLSPQSLPSFSSPGCFWITPGIYSFFFCFPPFFFRCHFSSQPNPCLSSPPFPFFSSPCSGCPLLLL